MPQFISGAVVGAIAFAAYVQYNYACLQLPAFLKGLGVH